MSDDDFDLPDETLDDSTDEFAADGFAADEFRADEPAAGEAGSPVLDRAASVRWEAPEPTGVQAVDDALTPLRELDDLPTAEHVPYYETAHRQLQDALADLDGA